MNLSERVEPLREFFLNGNTRSLEYRRAALQRLATEIAAREQAICEALYLDFRKPEFETIVTEVAIVQSEIRLSLKKLGCWAKPKRIRPALMNFPSCDKIYPEPYGTVLIIAPWNYPFQLVFSPLIGAIAAGNTVMIKPSEHAGHTARLVSDIVHRVFEPGHVSAMEGEADVAAALLRERWDYIFFTGSIPVGKIVARAAAEHLTPCTLELGGKNPCIIDETADLPLAARRVIWGKFINCGQTCIAPDYILVHEKVKTAFTELCRKEIQSAYGEDPKQSPDYARIINRKNFDTLVQYLIGEKLIAGGETDPDERYIAPTLIDNPTPGSAVMQQEIFGPLLPVIPYQKEADLKQILSAYGKPLAFYIFSKNKAFIRRMIRDFSFGGGTVNDTIVHFGNARLPFGGVGSSGTGAYHGRHSFDTFSHRKSVTTRATWLDLPMRYAPYAGKLKSVKAFLRWLS
jgi:aldehyde dehydrogenase (NAD+)